MLRELRQAVVSAARALPSPRQKSLAGVRAFKLFIVLLQSQRACGEIGRRARLRIW